MTITLFDDPRPVADAASTAIMHAAAPAAPALPTIKETVLAQFREAEATVTALAEKYRAVAYPVETTKGMNDAKAARLELREKGRYAVQRAETRIKSEVNDLKRVMASEVERLVAIVQPVEDAIDGQIKAREKVLADEKAERERIAAEAAAKEAARVQMHRDNLARLKGYVAQASGASSEKLAKAIEALRGITISDEWQEFQAEAAAALDDTLLTLENMLETQAQKEAHERAVAQQAAENARIAAELAEQKRALEQQAAELRRQQEEAAARAESERLEKLADERRAALATQPPAPAPAAPVPQPVDIAAPSPVLAAPAPVAAPVADEPATLKLGDICAMFGPGFTMTAAFVETIGVKHSATDKAAKLYRPSDVPRICAALQKLAGQVAARELSESA
jgi:hypothetical protein